MNLNKEEKMLIGNILDKYNKYLDNNTSTYSNFLNSRELDLVSKALDGKKIKYNIYDKYPFLEKKIIYFGEYLDYITIYRIDIDNSIKHSDILGTLFSLGLDNDMIGDIYVEDGYFYLTSLSRMDSFMEKEFTMIKRYPIKLKKVDEIILLKEHFKKENILVTSYRLDNIVSKIINSSRSIINEMIVNKDILLNYNEIKSSSILLKEGDILSIRKHGKYKIGSNLGLTKKNKFILEIIKYI